MSAGTHLSLVQAQRWMQHQVLQAGGDVAPIADDGIAEPGARLGAYVDAYRLRLLEVLGNDFPVLKARAGDAEFERLGRAYMDAHPSAHPSARWFGRHFPEWLIGAKHAGLWGELAAFEWAQGEVFDAADADTLTLGELAELPGEAWPTLTLRLHPSLRLVMARADVPGLLRAHAEARPWPQDTLADEPTAWLLWRRGFDIHWRALATDEAPALQAARAGANFAELCETLLHWNEPDAVALRAASLLKSWINDDLIAALVRDG